MLTRLLDEQAYKDIVNPDEYPEREKFIGEVENLNEEWFKQKTRAGFHYILKSIRHGVTLSVMFRTETSALLFFHVPYDFEATNLTDNSMLKNLLLEFFDSEVILCPGQSLRIIEGLIDEKELAIFLNRPVTELKQSEARKLATRFLSF